MSFVESCRSTATYLKVSEVVSSHIVESRRVAREHNLREHFDPSRARSRQAPLSLRLHLRLASFSMTAPVPARAASPDSAPAAKRVKTGSASLANVEAAALPFHSTLLDPANIQRLHQEHETSTPYKHAVINQLFEPAFLKKARQEIVEQISFREKETDICEFGCRLTSFT